MLGSVGVVSEEMDGQDKVVIASAGISLLESV